MGKVTHYSSSTGRFSTFDPAEVATFARELTNPRGNRPLPLDRCDIPTANSKPREFTPWQLERFVSSLKRPNTVE